MDEKKQGRRGIVRLVVLLFIVILVIALLKGPFQTQKTTNPPKIPPDTMQRP